jgi:hypothetical protein
MSSPDSKKSPIMPFIGVIVLIIALVAILFGKPPAPMAPKSAPEQHEPAKP